MDSGDYHYYFPEEIVANNILPRLPVKSLVRVRAVCKSWKSLVESSAFIAAHLRRKLLIQFNNPNQLFLLKLNRSDHVSENPAFGVDHSVTAAAAYIILPPIVEQERIIGACNGLICLDLKNPSKNAEAPTMILNPSIRKYVILPRPNIDTTYPCGEGSLRWTLFSIHRENKFFGYDSRTNDYKVLRILTTENNRGLPYAVELYSMAKGYWKTLSASATDFLANYYFGCGRIYSLGVVLNGALHWVQPRNFFGNVIICFDLDSESFSEMMVPQDMKDCGMCYLLKWEESLAFFEIEHISSHDSVGSFWLHVWFMKEYGSSKSWTKLDHSVHLKEGCLGEFLFFDDNGPLYFKGRDELVLSMFDPITEETTTKIVDLKTQEMTTIGTDEHLCNMRMDPLVESLVLLGHPDATSY